ncbi:TPA: hypothetical protein RPV57_001601 [Campylobacter fetus]|uniref:hypothetical protein n=1 Tax=Campylobacter fetus TaxID=196 RepID=UPI0005090EBA|nr:hypothetical protein [Campylobacter fetus]AIR78574.1 hypothetical protein CFF04554_0656 [Campylobacter fetus subsp. fetus 04/554]EGK8172925.1 hypothetical protein [Campylobacter fetus]HDX6332421.1 hypothetical protein [Campylobacter fetus]HEG4796524.1 hypothetical protein [Campylobacter fetus]HEG5098137.1 hypothetical protein [Campylobacter fetus]
MCDHVLVYDNSVNGRDLKLISEIENGEILSKHNISDNNIKWFDKLVKIKKE